MNLSGIFSGISRRADQNSQISDNQNRLNENPTKTIQFTTGQTLSGRVLSSSNGQITLSVNGTQVNGNVSSDLSFEEGKELTFTVKQGENGQIILTPLYENTANNQSVAQALIAAGIPQNQETQMMVSTMMREGLSVSKDSLTGMLQQINLFGADKTDSLVGLAKLGIDASEENIVQYENYRNLTHALTKGVTDVLSEIPAIFETLLAEGRGEEANTLAKNILSIFLVQNTEDLSNEEKNSTFVPTDNSDLMGQLDELENGSHNIELMNQENSQVKGNLQNETAQERNLHENLQVNEKVDDETLNSLKKLMDELQVKNPDANKQTSAENLLKTIYREMANENKEHDFAKLFQNPGFQKLVSKVIENQWLLRPETVAKDGSVKELYTKLFEHTKELAKALNSVSGESVSNLSQAVSNLRSNLDFMNQINQLSTYVQLPLKFENQNGNGDLYVFTDKKSLAEKNGNVTALLHLSMEHLGDLDVFVAMMNQNVKTKFYVADESVIDFIAENVHLLDERLAARGYSMHAEVLNREAMKDEGIEDGLMSKLLKKSSPILYPGNKEFDVKA